MRVINHRYDVAASLRQWGFFAANWVKSVAANNALMRNDFAKLNTYICMYNIICMYLLYIIKYNIQY